jgi:hypothetical protein
MSEHSHEAFIPIVPFDLQATMAQQVLGLFDPTGSCTTGGFAKVHLDSDGQPATWRFDTRSTGVLVRVSGRSADALLRGFLEQFPLGDGCDAFRPGDPLLQRLVRSFGGLRLIRVPWAFDVAAGAVLQQRVRWRVAYDDFRRIAKRWGTPVPGGSAFPCARQLAAVSVAAIEAMGIDPKRARALAVLARREAAHPFLDSETDPTRLRLRLVQLPGIGPWTANMVAGFAAGDPDAVPTGDLHLPGLVTGALAREPDGTDQRMLELLEPYRGQRFRVVRLISWAAARAPHVLAQGGRRPEATRVQVGRERGAPRTR